MAEANIDLTVTNAAKDAFVAGLAQEETPEAIGIFVYDHPDVVDSLTFGVSKDDVTLFDRKVINTIVFLVKLGYNGPGPKTVDYDGTKYTVS